MNTTIIHSQSPILARESRLRALAFPVLAGVAAVVLSGCHREPSAATEASLPEATVSAVMVERHEHQAFEEVVGSVQSRQRAEIGPKISARVEAIDVVPGSVVSQGELLVRLDDREIQARLDQASATLEQAENDLRRFTGLLEQESVTQAEFDSVQARARVARAAKVEAETMLAYTRITAPFDGVITHKRAEVGDLAQPGRALVVLEDPDALRLDADVPEALITAVEPGAELLVTVASLPTPIPGRVSEIAPAADPQSRTFRVKLDLPASEALRLGQFGRVAVPVAGSTALTVPSGAVVVRGQMEIVFVVEADKARLRLVKTGKRLGDRVELLSGIDLGEQVITDGLKGLKDGQPVRLN
jgi:RND family efflux transporter MFP subunit